MKIFTIARYDFVKLFRDKSALIIMIAVPVIFTFVMGLAYGSAGSKGVQKIPVGLVNLNSSELVKELIANIKKDNTIYFIEMKEDELLQKVKSSSVEAGFIIPDDFGKKLGEGKTAEIKVLKLPTSAGFNAVKGTIGTAVLKMHIKDVSKRYFGNKISGPTDLDKDLIVSDMIAKLGEKLEEPSKFTVSDIRVSGDEESTDFNGKAHSSIGVAVMFVMFAVILGAGEILEEKKNRTWDRLIITPTSRTTVMLGKITGTFLRGWAQVVFLIIFGWLVMGVSWGNSIFASMVLFSVYLLCLTSLGMFLSSLVKTNAQLGAYSSVIIIATSMLSGCYWPVEMVPGYMQRIAMLFPQYWAIKALNNTVNANMGIASIVNHLLVLSLMGVLFFILGIISGRLRGNLNKAVQIQGTYSS
ncbi:MAG: ABC transporter permease [Bacillota bacterium]